MSQLQSSDKGASTLCGTALVLLGASNLTHGIAAVVEASTGRLGAPLDFYVAYGNGRSYGQKSRVFARDLPGIRDCALWGALEARPPGAVKALITDIGNDILFGASLPEIEAWLRFCLESLRALSAELVLVQLPMEILRRASSAQVALVKHLFHPGVDFDLRRMLSDAEKLARLIQVLARDYGATLVEQKRAWYGFDPIHFKRSQRQEAWGAIMGQFTANVPPTLAPSTKVAQLRQWAYLVSRPPERRWLFGREQRSAQPSGRLADGSTLSIY